MRGVNSGGLDECGAGGQGEERGEGEERRAGDEERSERWLDSL